MRLAALALLSLLIAGGTAHAAVPANVLYGTTAFNILTIGTTDGTITNLEQQEEFAFRGLTFDSSGRLFASACALVPVFGFVDCASAPSNPSFHPYDRLGELDPVTAGVSPGIGRRPILP